MYFSFLLQVTDVFSADAQLFGGFTPGTPVSTSYQITTKDKSKHKIYQNRILIKTKRLKILKHQKAFLQQIKYKYFFALYLCFLLASLILNSLQLNCASKCHYFDFRHM